MKAVRVYFLNLVTFEPADKEDHRETATSFQRGFPKADLGVVIINYCCIYKATFILTIVFLDL
jgi:hypothetical protein